MKRNRLLTIFEALAGVVLGAPAAVFAVFMFPNIEFLASDQFSIDRLTLYDRLHHFWIFGAQIIGYAALVCAFFSKAIHRQFLRLLLLVGLFIGILASLVYGPFDLHWLLNDLKGLRWDGHTAANLFFLVYSLLLAAAGVSLFLKHFQFSQQELQA